MIKTHKQMYKMGNQPKIVSSEKIVPSKKESVKSDEANVCLNCHKKKCSGTDDCFKKEKNK